MQPTSGSGHLRNLEVFRRRSPERRRKRGRRSETENTEKRINEAKLEVDDVLEDH